MTQRITHYAKSPYLWLRDSITGLLFERRYGVRTTGVIDLHELGISDTERIRYKASGWLTLRRIMPAREVREHDVFSDFGCGMGRVVLEAARYRFKRVEGVELSEELTRIARRNISRNRATLRCQNVVLSCTDALSYRIPDDLTVAFFYNPFIGSIFSQVIDNLIESVDRFPRTIRIIYSNPVEEAYLLGTGRVRLVRTLRGFRPGANWSRSNSTRMYLLEPRGHRRS